MPSSNFPSDVEDVIQFYARNPLKSEKTEFVWTYERRGKVCKVIPICASGQICDQRIKLANCEHNQIAICVNIPKE